MKERYRFDWDENGTRVRIDTKTGKKVPVDEIVERAAKEGKLITPEQAMANEHKRRYDDIKEV